MNRHLTILIAEDEENDVLLLKRALRMNNLTNPVQVVTDGQMAIDYLCGEGVYQDRAQFPFPSLLITDLKMPKKTGFDVLKWLREHPECNVVPVLILTSSREDRDIKEAYKLGANCYLTKPSSFDDLLKMVACIAEFWAMCEKPKMPARC